MDNNDCIDVGIRVVSNYGEKQGSGEEVLLGTLKSEIAQDEFLVCWDTGLLKSCKIQEDGKKLRVYDLAQANMRHTCVCDSCECFPLFGLRWRCMECADYDLCSACYHGDKHNQQHRFVCCPIPEQKSIDVDWEAFKVVCEPRETSRKVAASGILKDCYVQRGLDWKWADEDGGSSNRGKVMGFHNCLAGKDVAIVKWPDFEMDYRVGCGGKVDLTVVDFAGTNTCVYLDHLPLMSDALWRAIRQVNQYIWSQHKSQFRMQNPYGIPANVREEQRERQISELLERELQLLKSGDAEAAKRHSAYGGLFFPSELEGRQLLDPVNDACNESASKSSDADKHWRNVEALVRRADYLYYHDFVKQAIQWYASSMELVRKIDSRKSYLKDLHWKIAACLVKLNLLRDAYSSLQESSKLRISFNSDPDLFLLNLLRHGFASLEPLQLKDKPVAMVTTKFFKVHSFLKEGVSYLHQLRETIRDCATVTFDQLEQDFRNMLFFFTLSLKSLYSANVYTHAKISEDRDLARAAERIASQMSERCSISSVPLQIVNPQDGRPGERCWTMVEDKVEGETIESLVTMLQSFCAANASTDVQSRLSAFDQLQAHIVRTFAQHRLIQLIKTCYPEEIVKLLKVDDSENLCLPLGDCNYKFVKKIGSGACGTVYEAQSWMKPKRVAVKVLHLDIASLRHHDNLQEIKTELEMNIQLSHSYYSGLFLSSQMCEIVPLVVLSPANTLSYHYLACLEMPLANQNLDQWVKDRNTKVDDQGGLFSDEDYLNAVIITKAVTNALRVLHNRPTPVVHGDLHLGNVLISTDGSSEYPVASIADFSNSKLANKVVKDASLKPFSSMKSPKSDTVDATKQNDIHNLGRIIYYLFLFNANYIMDSDVTEVTPCVDLCDEYSQELIKTATDIFKSNSDPKLEPDAYLEKVLKICDRFLTSRSINMKLPEFIGFDGPPLQQIFQIGSVIDDVSLQIDELASLLPVPENYSTEHGKLFWRQCLSQYFANCRSYLGSVQLVSEICDRRKHMMKDEVELVFENIMKDFVVIESYAMLNLTVYAPCSSLKKLLNEKTLSAPVCDAMLRWILSLSKL